MVPECFLKVYAQNGPNSDAGVSRDFVQNPGVISRMTKKYPKILKMTLNSPNTIL